MAERQPSKLNVAGSIPVSRSNLKRPLELLTPVNVTQPMARQGGRRLSAASRQTSSRVGGGDLGARTRNQEAEGDLLADLSRGLTQDVAGGRGLLAGVLADLDLYLAASPRLR